MSFFRRAKPVPRCKQCFSEHHSVDTCPDMPHAPLLQSDVSSAVQPSQEVCRRFIQERYTHVLPCCLQIQAHLQLEAPHGQLLTNISRPLSLWCMATVYSEQFTSSKEPHCTCILNAIYILVYLLRPGMSANAP